MQGGRSCCCCRTFDSDQHFIDYIDAQIDLIELKYGQDAGHAAGHRKFKNLERRVSSYVLYEAKHSIQAQFLKAERILRLQEMDPLNIR